jgi:hypothetical protein
LKSIEINLRSDEMGELLFVLVIGLAVVASVTWLVDGYKKELRDRQNQRDVSPLLGVLD